MAEHAQIIQFDSLVESQTDTLNERVLAELRRGLLSGVFAPGQPITLRKLAADLGTSPMPVRAAIARLVAERALEMLPNRSVVVPMMTEARFAELTEIRQAMEGMAAAQACHNVDRNLIATLAAINEQLKRAIKTQDMRSAMIDNRSFHFVLYRASHSRTLLPLIETLWLQAAPFMFYSLTLPEVRWDATHHRDILAALRARDVAAVRRGIEADAAETMENLRIANAFARRHAVGQRILRLVGR